MQRLEALRGLALAQFLADADLRAIAERNLEIAAQCCIDIAHRIVALEGANGPSEARTSLLRLGEFGVLTAAEAERLAPIADFRKVLLHESADLDWRRVHEHLLALDGLRDFAASVRGWLGGRRT